MMISLVSSFSCLSSVFLSFSLWEGSLQCLSLCMLVCINGCICAGIVCYMSVYFVPLGIYSSDIGLCSPVVIMSHVVPICLWYLYLRML